MPSAAGFARATKAVRNKAKRFAQTEIEGSEVTEGPYLVLDGEEGEQEDELVLEQAFGWAVLSPATTGASGNKPRNIAAGLTYPERRIDRVSVPGGRQPNWSRPFRELARWHGTAFKGVVSSLSTYVILGIYGGFLVLGYWGSTLEGGLVGAESSAVASLNVSVLTFLTTFMFGTYYSFVLSRWHERFNCINDCTAMCTRVTYYAACWIGPYDKPLAARLMRLTNLMMHMHHMKTFGPLDEGRWGVMMHRGLVTAPEKNSLQKLRKAGTEVCFWCQSIVEEARQAGRITGDQAYQLNAYIAHVQALSYNQPRYRETGMPFSLFHMLSMLIVLLLLVLMWNSTIRFVADIVAATCNAEPEEAGCVSTIFPLAATFEVTSVVCVIIGILMVWKVGLWLTEPFGDDAGDYDVDLDLQDSWVEALERITLLSGTRATPQVSPRSSPRSVANTPHPRADFIEKVSAEFVKKAEAAASADLRLSESRSNSRSSVASSSPRRLSTELVTRNQDVMND